MGVAADRSKSVWAAALLVGVALVLATAAPLERKLLAQPSCLAFAGMKRPSAETVPWAIRERDLAIAQGAISRPRPPYVLITSVGAEAGLTQVVSAVKGAAGWEVSEASQPWDRSTQKLLPFQRLPQRHLDDASQQRLEKLIAKDCLYREPRFVPADPQVRFDLGVRSRTYDPTYRMIEVHDGARRLAVVQGHTAGVSGAVGDLVLAGSRGFLVEETD